MLGRTKRGTLGRRMLAAFVAVSLVPLLLAALLTYWRSSALLQQFVLESTEKTAQAYAADLDLFLELQRQRLRALPVHTAPDDTQLDALLMVDATGQIVARSSDPIDEWVITACRDLVANPDQAMTHAGRGFAHQVVVGVERAGGLLCGRVDFTLHQDMLSERASGALGGAAFIVDRSGTVVCHAFENDEPNRGRGDLLGGPASQAAAHGEGWSGAAQTRAGPVLAAFAPAASLPWGVWVEVPEAVAVAPLRAWWLQGLAGAGLLALTATIAAMWVVGRFVEPVHDVVDAAKRIASGQLGERVPVRGDDEIAELAQEFNRMGEALQSSYEELDARVQDRTRQLAAAREFSDLLLDTMRERITVVDAAHRVVRANRAAMEAHGPDLVGNPCADHGLVDRVLRSGQAHSEERRHTDDGYTEILRVDTYPLPAQDGPCGAVVEIARDVTAIRRMQAQLAHQEKMASLGTLAAGLAHEIGNPLASMSSELELLERMWDPQDARRSLPVLRDQVRRMTGLLRQLMDLGRPSSEQVAPFDAHTLVDEVVRLLQHDPRSRDVRLRAEMDAAVGTLFTSRDKLAQVLVNLGLNALDAVEGAGNVTLAVVPDPVGGGLQFRVSDDGPGLSPAAAERVFDPFYTTKAPGTGTGLGLFVSARIAQGIGGRLELAPQPPPGATFVLTLPPCACEGCIPALGALDG
ncbi:MAG: HAMP domain-containing protein [Myxococcales bacterium]|nr:HAMP domain-containing protein [Myxococcales bacterium]